MGDRAPLPPGWRRETPGSRSATGPADWPALIAGELDLRPPQVAATMHLLADGATVPFLARYRKEATGSLDEVQIAAIRDRTTALAELDQRRAAIIASLQERSLLTPDLAAALTGAATLTALEDLYLPYRPKRRTRATMARERGLAPLAALLLAQRPAPAPLSAATSYVNPEADVPDAAAALAGARDIIAEQVSEDAAARADLRGLFRRRGRLQSKLARGKQDDPAAARFRDYHAWSEPLATVPGHRLHAMLRGEAAGLLSLSIRPPADEAIGLLLQRFIRARNLAADEVTAAVTDGYERLLAPSLENELRAEAKTKADAEAIRVFAANLRELLLAPPLGAKRVLALDPGFRTGAKLVCLDPQGKLLHHDTIFPTQGPRQVETASRTLRELVARFAIEAIAIGNGTGGRETEAFVRGLGLPAAIPVVLVNESGASVYSASEIARTEFPDHDVTVRGAVSIGRRLLDPLAELVKIDPKAIGVGQYQHDVDQAALKAALDDTVASCVNAVGVEVNTASAALLTYVAGLGPTLARNLVAWRDEHGPFRSRRDLRQVPRLGPKAFEQAAGFLRVRDGAHPLDASAVHPERYALVERMAADLGREVGSLLRDPAAAAMIDIDRYVSDDVGEPTLRDIISELARPGRDPRPPFTSFAFAAEVQKLADLRPGMVLPGIVTNVTRFGAFVDIGVHQDGLVHISQLADRYVRDPAEVVKVRQAVQVTVLEVDPARRRISLSLRGGARDAIPVEPGRSWPKESDDRP